MDLDDVDAARAQEYAPAGGAARARARCADSSSAWRRLRADASPLGLAHAALAEAAASTTADRVQREYFDLFIGLGRGELMPYGSYYLTGFLHERPLARLREDLKPLGIERSEGNVEPEDHAAILCEVMAGLIDGSICGDRPDPTSAFSSAISSRGSGVSSPISSAPKTADFYVRVGTVGRVFIDIETEAFALPS